MNLSWREFRLVVIRTGTNVARILSVAILLTVTFRLLLGFIHLLKFFFEVDDFLRGFFLALLFLNIGQLHFLQVIDNLGVGLQLSQLSLELLYFQFYQVLLLLCQISLVLLILFGYLYQLALDQLDRGNFLLQLLLLELGHHENVLRGLSRGLSLLL